MQRDAVRVWSVQWRRFYRVDIYDCRSQLQDMDYGQYLTWVYERYAAGNAQSTCAKDYR